MFRRLAQAVGLLLLLLMVVVAVNTLRRSSGQLEVPPAPVLAIDEAAVAQRLSAAIRARTVSSADDASLNADQFRALHEHLRDLYPRLHAALNREVVGELSLLYRWQGSDAKAAPMLLMAHQDVVPIAPGTDRDWAVEPFSGSDTSNSAARIACVRRLSRCPPLR